jgi:PAS domain S-box-containing protein
MCPIVIASKEQRRVRQEMEGEMEANSNKRIPDQHALAYADNIIATLREPFVVLDKSLRVRTANAAFYRIFHVSKEVTEGCLVYELGNGQWDIPQLRTLLPQVLSNSHPVEGFEVDHDFPDLGRRNMLLNARRFPPESSDPHLLLLAIEDVTDSRRADAAMQHSEVRYRRLFQTAKDGILILDADTGKVIDANPFMTALLGYSHDEFLGKELWEIGLFRDIKESQAAYRELQEKGYVRYENLPLESRSGQKVEVEFVSNVYAENCHQVVQCNVRDITERSRLQRQVQEQAAALADLDRRKDEFLAMLSHELRNPLAPIVNAALLLRLHSNRNRLQGIENPVLRATPREKTTSISRLHPVPSSAHNRAMPTASAPRSLRHLHDTSPVDRPPSVVPRAPPVVQGHKLDGCPDPVAPWPTAEASRRSRPGRGRDPGTRNPHRDGRGPRLLLRRSL